MVPSLFRALRPRVDASWRCMIPIRSTTLRDGILRSQRAEGPTIFTKHTGAFRYEDPGFDLLPVVEVATPMRLPVVFRSGAVELRGEMLLEPRP